MIRRRPSARRAAGLDVTVTSDRGRVPGAADLGKWLERAAPPRARGTVAIALVSDARMRRLNNTYRGIDSATDVLSFRVEDDGVGPWSVVRRPSSVVRGPSSGVRAWCAGRRRQSPNLPVPKFPGHKPQARSHKSLSFNHLGDLAIAVGVAKRQARDQGHGLGTELKVLALHGLLHLLGYDHDRDRGTMERVEDRLRKRAGLPRGLIGRSSRRTVLP